MRNSGNFALGVALALFAAFLINVTLGAMQFGAVLNDVGEMLLLFSACIFFVVAILGLERREKSRLRASRKSTEQGGETL